MEGIYCEFHVSKSKDLGWTLIVSQGICFYTYIFLIYIQILKATVRKLVTSNNFITGTGLKKWSPTNLSFLFVTDAISVIESEDVLDAKIVCSGAIYSKQKLQ